MLDEGETMPLIERDDSSPTIAEFLKIYASKSRDPAMRARMLVARGLGDAWRQYFEKGLQPSQS